MEGSTSTLWFGTAIGVSTGPTPPAATAASAAAVVGLLSSSSQSISSSPVAGAGAGSGAAGEGQYITAERMHKTRLTAILLVIFLQSRDEVGFVSRDRKASI